MNPTLRPLNNNSYPLADDTRLTEIHLTARIKDLKPEDFRSLARLESLTIGPEPDEISNRTSPRFRSVREILVLKPGLFVEMPHLKQLNLWMKGVVGIAEDAFAGLPKLQELNLRGNQIRLIEAGAFNGLAQLESLSLEKNDLREVKTHFFRGLSSLSQLNLQSNQISRIEEGAFSDFPALVSLNLHHNHLMQLGERTFEGLINLGFLDLEGNPLRKLGHPGLDEVRDGAQVSLTLKGQHLCASKTALLRHLHKVRRSSAA